MAVDSIGSSASTSGAAKIDSGAFGDLSSTDFVKVLIEQMSNQDPFQPNDSSAVLQQLSNLRNIESQLSLQKSIESLVLQNNLSQAGGLIGREAEGLTTDNDPISGLVTAVQVVGGKAVLELDSGRTLAMSRVTAIRQGV